MATLTSLQFEMERRVILFKPTTTMPDLSQLGYNADPNLIVTPSTPGEQLIYNCPNGTRYLNTDASGNTITEWFKKAQPNGWLPLGSGGGSIYGTDSSTWQLDLSNSGVILQSDGSSNLIIKDPDGSLGTLIVGNLVIDNLTGYLRAIDGSVFVDSSISVLKSASGILTGDDLTKDFVIVHNIYTLNHMTSVYDNSTNEEIFPEITIGASTNYISFYAPPPTGNDHRAVIIGF